MAKTKDEGRKEKGNIIVIGIGSHLYLQSDSSAPQVPRSR